MAKVPRLEWDIIDHGERALGGEMSRGMSLNSYLYQRSAVENFQKMHEKADAERSIAAAREIVDLLGVFIDEQSSILEQGDE